MSTPRGRKPRSGGPVRAGRRVAWSAACAALVALSTCRPAHEELLSGSSTYAVVEVRAVRGEASSAMPGPVGPIRLRTLVFVPETPRARRFADAGFPRRSCERCTLQPGRTLVTDRLASGLRVDPAWEPGEVRRVRGEFLEYRHEGGYTLLRAAATAAGPAEVELRLVKRCVAPVFYRETSHVRWSSGMISLPSGTFRYGRVEAAAPCAGPEDTQDIVETAERAAWQDSVERTYTAEEAARRSARADSAREHRDRRFAGYEREADRYVTPAGAAPLSAAERALNPRTAGLMAAAGIRRVEMVRRCGSTRTRKDPVVPNRYHTYCFAYVPVLRVAWAAGGSSWVAHPGNARWTAAWRGAELRAGVLRVEARPPGSGAARRLGFGETPPATPEGLASRVAEAVEFAARELRRPGDPDTLPLPNPDGWKEMIGPGEKYGEREDEWLDVSPPS